MNADQIENWFTYHAPNADSLQKYDALRTAAKAFAHAINMACPEIGR